MRRGGGLDVIINIQVERKSCYWGCMLTVVWLDKFLLVCSSSRWRRTSQVEEALSISQETSVCFAQPLFLPTSSSLCDKPQLTQSESTYASVHTMRQKSKQLVPNYRSLACFPHIIMCNYACTTSRDMGTCSDTGCISRVNCLFFGKFLVCFRTAFFCLFLFGYF